MYTVLFGSMYLPRFFSFRDEYCLQYYYELLSLKHTNLPPAIATVFYIYYKKLTHVFDKQQNNAFVYGAQSEFLATD
jgi:hypothetical protein